MSNEHLAPTQLIEQIKHIIESKNWYSLTESSRFIWKESVKLMAESISQEIGHIEPDEIQEIIENSFGPDSLSTANSKSFIDCLLEIDPELVLWSEGDIPWQETKASRTGLTNRENIKVEFISKSKVDRLKDIILSLADETEEEICIIVIDDKEKNLIHALDLQDQVSDRRITVKTYQINLRDDQTDSTACLTFLSEITEKNIKLIVDMDGVLVDTDRVLAEIVPQKLAKMLTKKI